MAENRQHKAEYDKIFSSKEKDKDTFDFADEKVDGTSTSLKRKLEPPPLKAVLEKKKVWDINHPKSVELHYAIGQMIAVDNQPYSFVENESFENLMFKAQLQYNIPSREYFEKNIVQEAEVPWTRVQLEPMPILAPSV
ncbi:hypothetical protein AVEN_265060-1 [Araneus ventricosus]|uniref:Uncharacterized protein n=1 Tax=Araneus ventricosus TaxID=182803 RepID=A0A4Y2R377_ARAVE|nr:hypothetical protein AVEN_265060-1 [Araneus ventricosus]